MRILVFSMAALIVLSLSSCTKENMSVSEPLIEEKALWQASLDEMNHALQEIMETLEPLKKLSKKDAEALKSSTDLPAYLAKSGVDVEAFQRQAHRHAAALQEAQRSGASDEIIVASIQKLSEPVVKQIESAYPEVAYAKSTPCYDAYELDFVHTSGVYLICSAVSGGTGCFMCYLGCLSYYAWELHHISAEYDTCLGSTYGG